MSERAEQGSSRGFLNKVKANRSGRRRPPGTATDGLQGAMADARHRSRSGDWDTSDANSWLGLHALCFKMIYRETPEELEGGGKFRKARARVRRFVEARPELSEARNVALMIHWAWEDHQGKLEWARSKRISMKPPSFKKIFSRATLVAWVESLDG